MKKKSNNNNQKNLSLFKSVLIAVVSGLSVVLFQQLFFKSNLNYELRNEILKENYEYYVAMQHFSDKYSIVRWNYLTAPKEGYIDLLAGDKINHNGIEKIIKADGKTYFPSNATLFSSSKTVELAIDSLKQKKWQENKKFIIENKNKIDQDIYNDFLKIIKIVDKNPWPKKNLSMLEIKDNIWSDKQFVEAWFSINLDLWEKTYEYIGIRQ
ncbi:hypothetical protein [Psychroserpens ponticola]|uniref:Uncharacterized protein n=1 Tax=Psychroserpens ponticola TaxID=2932268 RepID=A0ABY7S2G3_9FLAO|nr:hypothetical protein [Psychroserpens ponticola]WCO03578.1 hypothetical protein MUN68_008725 [Psychroserpens ponticola]